MFFGEFTSLLIELRSCLSGRERKRGSEREEARGGERKAGRERERKAAGDKAKRDDREIAEVCRRERKKRERELRRRGRRVRREKERRGAEMEGHHLPVFKIFKFSIVSPIFLDFYFNPHLQKLKI